MKRAYIFNTGCIRRALDSTRIYNYLIKNGWAFTNNLSSADLVIVSTCGAVDQSEELTLIALNNIARKRSKSSRLIITGCLPKINPAKIQAVEHLGDFEYVPTRNLDKFDTVINASVKMHEIPDANLVTKESGLLDYVLAYRFFRHSFFLNVYKRLSTNRDFLRMALVVSENINTIRKKLGLPARASTVPYYNIRIAEGCAFACTYCSIRFATGRIQSKPIDQILEEFKNGLREGHKLFQLVCEDTGSYGFDLNTNIAALLRRMVEVEGDYQLILIDFGGYWLVKYYDELQPIFEKNSKKIRELYVALQSGSDNILKAMRRPEKSADVVARLKELKHKIPQLILRTTVIIGFPGETEEDFWHTVEAVRNLDFDAVEVNKYEDRPGTVSSRMENKIPQDVIERRCEIIEQYC